jgi:hypothetical protein
VQASTSRTMRCIYAIVKLRRLVTETT